MEIDKSEVQYKETLGDHSSDLKKSDSNNGDELAVDTNYQNIDKLVKSVGPTLAPLVPEYGSWYNVSHLLRLNLLLGILCLSSSASGYDNSLINSVQAFTEWDVDLMHSPANEWLGFIVVSLAIGSIVSNIVAPYISDYYGRVTTCRLAVVGLIAFAIGQTFVQTDTQFIITRAFIGFFSGLASQTVVLVAELSFPVYRGFFSCFYMTMYYAGSFLGGWTAYGSRNLGDWSWRTVCLVQVAYPVLIACALFKSTPESPRWLISKGRFDEAKDILFKYHAGNDTRFRLLVEAEYDEICTQIEMDKQHEEPSWKAMFTGRPNQWRSFVTISLGFFQQWNGVGIISYYLVKILKSVGIDDTKNQTLINGFLQLWNFIWAAYASFTVDKWGRRVLFLWSTIGMLVSYIILTGLSGAYAQLGDKHAGIGVVVFLFIYYAHYDIAFTPLSTCYPVEIWPYQLRAKGVGMEHLASYGGLLFNQFVNSIALSKISWKYYFVYIAILISMIFIIGLFYPETKGNSLEEVEQIFEEGDYGMKLISKDFKRKSLLEDTKV